VPRIRPPPPRKVRNLWATTHAPSLCRSLFRPTTVASPPASEDRLAGVSLRGVRVFPPLRGKPEKTNHPWRRGEFRIALSLRVAVPGRRLFKPIIVSPDSYFLPRQVAHSDECCQCQHPPPVRKTPLGSRSRVAAIRCVRSARNQPNCGDRWRGPGARQTTETGNGGSPTSSANNRNLPLEKRASWMEFWRKVGSNQRPRPPPPPRRR